MGQGGTIPCPAGRQEQGGGLLTVALDAPESAAVGD